MSRIQRHIEQWTQMRSDRKPPMGFWLAHVLWPWMTLNWPTSRSSKLHVKYCENGDRYNDCVNGSRIENQPCATDWHHELWPWMKLKCASLDNGVENSMHWADTRSIERTYFLFVVHLFEYGRLSMSHWTVFIAINELHDLLEERWQRNS